MKTICFDLRALQIGHQNRGIGLYLSSLLERLPDDGNHYLFYCFDKNDPIKSLGIRTAVDYELVRTKTLTTAFRSPKDILSIYRLLHPRFKELRAKRPDTFVQFDFTLGTPQWPGVRTVVIGYDLIPLIMKDEYLPGVLYAWRHSSQKLRGIARASYYRYRYRIHYRAFKRASQVVCISKATTASFRDLLDIPEQNLATVPLAPVLADSAPDLSVARSIGKPYIFYIGGTDSRKRIRDIVRAYNIARGRGMDIDLVLAGNEFRSVEQMTDPLAQEAVKRSPYRDGIRLVGFVSDAEKQGLYSLAHAFVLASAYEGFGLPVIEAMAASCPVIAYDNSSISEAAGGAALLVETGDYVALAARILVLRDGKLRARLVDAGRHQAAKFTWESYIPAFRKTL